VNTGLPMMLLRARIQPHLRDEFDRWFDTEHLANVRRIPGIARAMVGRTSGPTRLGVFFFMSAEAVQPALSSPQAAYTRGTWARWQEHLEEMSLELWAQVVTMPIYEEIN